LSDAPEIIRQENIDHLYVALPLDEHVKMLDLIESTSREMVDVKVVPDLVQFLALRARLEDLDGVPIINIHDVPLQGLNAVIKRTIDIGISGLGALLLSVPCGLIALGIKYTSPGPVFYRQERMGLDGRPFWVYKFRSMRVDAEDVTGPIWAREDDPRCTPVGRFLRQWDLDEAYVYGLIRQESRFMADARSRVGAAGLMQLMPATARWVANQIPVKPFSTAMLTQPELNILMGTYYFRRVLDELGHPVLAVAAYNAGPGRARRWRDERTLDGAIYVETIPFSETRDYVKKVLANTVAYGRQFGSAPSLKAMLSVIPPKGGRLDEIAAAGQAETDK